MTYFAYAILLLLAGFLIGQFYGSALMFFGTPLTIATILGILIVGHYILINKTKNFFSNSQLYILILNIFSLFVFAKIVNDANTKQNLIDLDVFINEKFASWSNSFLNEIMILITDLGSPTSLFVISGFLLIMFISKRKWVYSILLTVGMIAGGLLELWIKSIIQRERPVSSLIEIHGYSLPSGHATMATIFFSVLLYIIICEIKNRKLKLFFGALAILAFLIVGLSRIYLSVHWTSDVVAGFAFGIFWVTFLVLILNFAKTLMLRNNFQYEDMMKLLNSLSKPSTRKKISYVLGLLIAVLIFILMAVWSQQHADLLRSISTQAGFFGIASYIFILAISIIFAPLSTGFLVPIAANSYGPFLASVYSILGWTIGSMVSFWIARFFGKKMTKEQKFIKKIQHYEKTVPKYHFYGLVILLRMAVPVDVLSYALGFASSISYKAFFVTTVIGITPLTLLFSYASVSNTKLQILFALFALTFFIAGSYFIYRKNKG